MFSCCGCAKTTDAADEASDDFKVVGDSPSAKTVFVSDLPVDECIDEDGLTADPPIVADLVKNLSQDCISLDLPKVPSVEEVVPDEEFKPMPEDQAIFDFDIRRMESASVGLESLRARIEKELLSLIGGYSPSVVDQHRHFCSDSTLLRYLCTCDGNKDKAYKMIQSTLQWRAKHILAMRRPGACELVCPSCLKDPRSHCFLNVGLDVAKRPVIYSCAGRASNKKPEDGMQHMAFELERIFNGNSAPGKIVWIIDFAGFAFADLNPRTGAMAVPMFANHYAERFAQIVLFGMPTFFSGVYSALIKLVDPVTQRKIVMLRSEEARRRYVDHYWKGEAAMVAWLDEIVKCKACPGSYPGVEFSGRLGDAHTTEIINRCIAMKT